MYHVGRVEFGVVTIRPYFDVLVAGQKPLHARAAEPLPDLDDQRVGAAILRRL